MARQFASDNHDRDIEVLLSNYRSHCQDADLACCPDLAAVARFVRDRHAFQVRKDGSSYYNHVKNVGDIASWLAAAWPMSPYGVAVCAAAGLLHDCQEDRGVDFEDVEKIANAEVAVLVAFVSDDKRLPSAFRHQRYLERLAAAPLRAQIVKLADLIDNSRDALLALDPIHLRTGRRASVSQQLDDNRRIMGRWARKARDAMGVLTLVSKLDAYAAALATIDLVLEKAEVGSGPP